MGFFQQFYDKLKGDKDKTSPAEESKPVRSDSDYIREIAIKFRPDLEKLGGEMIQQAQKLARKNGLIQHRLDYLLQRLVEGRSLWPTMPDSQERALAFMVYLAIRGGVKRKPVRQMVEPETDIVVNEVIKKLGRWSEMNLLAAVGDLLGIIDQTTRPYKQDHPEVGSRSDAASHLFQQFEVLSRKNRRRMTHDELWQTMGDFVRLTF